MYENITPWDVGSDCIGLANKAGTAAIANKDLTASDKLQLLAAEKMLRNLGVKLRMHAGMVLPEDRQPADG